jgi:hypothetical protein
MAQPLAPGLVPGETWDAQEEALCTCYDPAWKHASNDGTCYAVATNGATCNCKRFSPLATA